MEKKIKFTSIKEMVKKLQFTCMDCGKIFKGTESELREEYRYFGKECTCASCGEARIEASHKCNATRKRFLFTPN